MHHSAYILEFVRKSSTHSFSVQWHHLKKNHLIAAARERNQYQIISHYVALKSANLARIDWSKWAWWNHSEKMKRYKIGFEKRLTSKINRICVCVCMRVFLLILYFSPFNQVMQVWRIDNKRKSKMQGEISHAFAFS